MNPISSVNQDNWKEITEAIRMQIQKNCQKLPSMTGDEIKAFISLANDAMSLDTQADLYDVFIQSRKSNP